MPWTNFISLDHRFIELLGSAFGIKERRDKQISNVLADEMLPPKKICRYSLEYTSIFQGILFGSKGWCMVTPYHPFSTLWKIQFVCRFKRGTN